MHKLLARQLRQCFGAVDAVPAAARAFVSVVDRAYQQADDDRAMLEHSLETVSDELTDRFLRLRDALAESQRAETELLQAMSALRATLESTTDGILVVNAGGQMIQMNRRFVELWRIPEGIVDSRDDQRALECVLEQLRDPEEFLAKVRSLYNQPSAESSDVLHFKDGRVFERYSRPQRVGGETVGRVWSFRDVSGKRQLEEQLRQSQKMDAIGQLAGGVAHDFNNLLTVIINYSSMLQDGDTDAATTSVYLSEILRAAERAAGLTRQLLAFSRRQLLQPRVLDLNAVLLAITPMLQRLIGEDIRIVTSPDPKLGTVLADPGQIEQVILNLAVNARDAMPNGGTISIETADIELGEWTSQSKRVAVPAGKYTMLALSDTGTGMDAVTQARIFEPFFTTKEPGRGTGLGLATVYGIVKQSGGFVWVYSELGLGTTFKVYLPRAAMALDEPEIGGARISLPRGSETVLLVEDEQAVRQLLSLALSRQGYAVREARSGAEALEMAVVLGDRLDLLLTDVVMPGMNSSQLVEQLRMRFPTVRVIYMSGYTDDDIVRRGLLDPELVFIQKPFTTAALARKVRDVLDGR